jgi:hypothetical protein
MNVCGDHESLVPAKLSCSGTRNRAHECRSGRPAVIAGIDTKGMKKCRTSSPSREPHIGAGTSRGCRRRDHGEIRLASTERRLDGGVWTDVHTNYYNVAVFRKLAEHAYQSLERGQRVIVVGKLKVRPWESNGRSGTSMDLEASSLGRI